MRSSWYEAFRTDMRSSVVVRAVEDSLGRVGSATVAATSWTTTRLALTGQGLRWGAASLLARGGAVTAGRLGEGDLCLFVSLTDCLMRRRSCEGCVAVLVSCKY